jgi:hypothetical protein
MPVMKYRDPQDGAFKLVPLTAERGATGPTGPAGENTPVRVINFPLPLDTWIINSDHLIDVVVIDSAGNVIEPGGIIYEGTNITLQFSAAFSGTAYCF